MTAAPADTRVTSAQLAHRLAQASTLLNGEAAQQLNAADSVLGDGDTGVTLQRVFGSMADAARTCATQSDPIDTTLMQCGRAAARATGSSLGTLCAIAFMQASRYCDAQQGLCVQNISDLLRTCIDAMSERGGAQLGDKTVLDALDAVAHALEGVPPEALAVTSRDAAERALNDFRPKMCLRGRARMYAERSRNVDDPGMLAIALITAALVS